MEQDAARRARVLPLVECRDAIKNRLASMNNDARISVQFARSTFSGFSKKISLLSELTKRDVLTRYRGSVLGVFWSLATPLLMLAVFTFVFGSVFKVKWGQQTELPKSELALILFSGLVVFNLFAESVTRAPTAITQNANYVKKIVFPLELLPLVNIGAALFHTAISLIVLLGGQLLIMGTIPPTAALVPIVLLPMLLTTIGICWAVAAIGVFVRDVGQTIGLIITALMFLSPIFYPLSALSPTARSIISLNPMAWPIEDVRSVLILGNMPDWPSYSVSLALGFVIAWIGLVIFQKTRKGFADVV